MRRAQSGRSDSNIMARYWVVGGEYTDTDFDEIVGGGPEQRIGPFDSYEAAKAEWQRLAWATVDDANTRYRIEEDKEEAAQHYWVVGGTYKDTHFAEPAEGTREQWFGPFDSYEAAKAEWQRLAWATVDDALSRYRIEKLSDDHLPPDGRAVPPRR
jgi:predicted nucleic acid-binding protein